MFCLWLCTLFALAFSSNHVGNIDSLDDYTLGQVHSRQKRIVYARGRYLRPKTTPPPKVPILTYPAEGGVDKENGPLQQLHRGDYISRILELSQDLVNQYNPTLGQKCWLCLSADPTSYHAIPVKSHLWVKTKATILLERDSEDKVPVSPIQGDFYEAFKRLGKSRLPITGPIATGVDLIGTPSLCVKRHQKRGRPVGSLTDEQCQSMIYFGPKINLVDIKLTKGIFPSAYRKFQQRVTFTAPPELNFRKDRWGGGNLSFESCPRPFRPPRFPLWFNLQSKSGLCILFPPGNTTSRYVFEGPSLRDKQKDPSLEIPLQPLAGMFIAGTLGVWTNENNRRIHAFSMNIGICVEEKGVFFLCGTNAYLCIPTNWTGTCTLAHLFPKIGVVSAEHAIPVPLLGHVQKRVPILIPLLVLIGMGTAVGTGIAGITHSVIQFRQISEELQGSLNRIAGTLIEVQNQIDSLAAVVLQNRRALDLLTAEKGGTCIFLGEDCCFYMNKSGVVREGARELQDRASKISQRLQASDMWFSWVPGSGWIKQMIFLFICAIAGLAFIPCVIPLLRQLSIKAVKELKVERELALTEQFLNQLGSYPMEGPTDLAVDPYVEMGPVERWRESS